MFSQQVIQYIGELCRYLLAQPVISSELQHTVRLAIGNGLRQHIWREFQSRFQIKQIGEFYGATEGNAGLLNTDNTVGAVGFLSQIIPQSSLTKLVRVHPETGELVRGSDGLAVECCPGQPGTLVAKITRTLLPRSSPLVSSPASFWKPVLMYNWTSILLENRMFRKWKS